MSNNISTRWVWMRHGRSDDVGIYGRDTKIVLSAYGLREENAKQTIISTLGLFSGEAQSKGAFPWSFSAFSSDVVCVDPFCGFNFENLIQID